MQVKPRFVFWLCWLLCAASLPGQTDSLRPAPASAEDALPSDLHSSRPAPVTPITDVPTLVFDAETKQYNAKPFEPSAPFTFNLTNVWTNDLTINNVKSSCGCTTVSLPPLPWTLGPAETGAVQAKVTLAGKLGTITKTLTFYTSVGTRVVNLRVVIPTPDNANLGAPDRRLAMAQAAVDPQAIFKGDCARCHADKGRAALGEQLYVADCAICHESPHRESIVPDLHALKTPTDFAFWKNVIANGKPHSLMPGFGMAQGGPLTDQQVLSLAGYLSRVIPSRPAPPAGTNSPVVHQARLASQF